MSKQESNSQVAVGVSDTEHTLESGYAVSYLDDGDGNADNNAAPGGGTNSNNARPQDPQQASSRPGLTRPGLMRSAFAASKQSETRRRRRMITPRELFRGRAFANREAARLTRVVSQRDLNFDDLQRAQRECHAMTHEERIRAWFGRKLGTSTELTKPSNQFYIPPPDEGTSFMHGFKHASHLRFMEFTIWMLRTSYVNFFLTITFGYFFYINLFALIICLIIVAQDNLHDRQCLSVWDYDANRSGFADNFELAFALSWTTFSTVGYGVVSPSTSISGCGGMRYFCAIEAFFGVVYFGLTGAICFAKIGRILSLAHVTFSSALCIRYGNFVGVGPQDGSVMSIEPTKQNESHEESPYPVLEFRIVNDRANEQGWEILDASVSGTVSIENPLAASFTDPGRASATDRNVILAYNLRSTRSGPEEEEEEGGSELHLTVHSMSISQDKHPYFKRVWYAHHTLNENSPLLKHAVKEEMRKRRGWPPEWNNSRSVRAALIKFKTMVLTMKGTSKVSSSEVFIEKRFEFEDIFVGWSFAGLLYLTGKKDGERKIRVDLSLIHDIVPQAGGGNEPLR